MSVRYSAIEMTPVARLVRDWQCKCLPGQIQISASQLWWVDWVSFKPLAK